MLDAQRGGVGATDGGTVTVRSSVEPLIGTRVDLTIEAHSETQAQAAEQLVLEEMVRLEDVFSVFRPASELCLWRSGRADASVELAEVLAAAERWWRISAGAFNPGAGGLREVWMDAARQGHAPDGLTIVSAVESLARLPFTVDGSGVHRLGDCSHIDLNAVAKGYIVDRAAAVGWAAPGVVGLTVNAGGDLLRYGSPQRVRIEDPRRTADNAPPLAVVTPQVPAVATSSGARRGFRIGDDWFSHVLDPRSGWPTGRIRSATVLAPTAMDADAFATAALVLAPEETLSCLDGLTGFACLLLDAEGDLIRSDGWPW